MNQEQVYFYYDHDESGSLSFEEFTEGLLPSVEELLIFYDVFIFK